MKTLFVGQNSIHLESVDSTNSYASELMRQIALPEGSLIYTFVQENGRGQRGNSWESEPNKNVALSLVMQPKFLSVEQQFLLTKITSLSVADLMAEFLGSVINPEEIRIKWPNDIYVKDKKITGILIENTLKDSQIQASVIGVGINVNQEIFKTKTATSMFLSANVQFNLSDVMDRFCELFEHRYLQLRTGKPEALDVNYLNLLYRLGKWAGYAQMETEFEGKITGVSNVGKLKMELRNGELKEFDLKEIRFI